MGLFSGLGSGTGQGAGGSGPHGLFLGAQCACAGFQETDTTPTAADAATHSLCHMAVTKQGEYRARVRMASSQKQSVMRHGGSSPQIRHTLFKPKIWHVFASVHSSNQASTKQAGQAQTTTKHKPQPRPKQNEATTPAKKMPTHVQPMSSVKELVPALSD